MRGLFGRRGFEVRASELPDRELPEGYARLSVKACGVCGTDLHFLRHNADWTPLGHEIAAIVTQVSGGSGRISANDMVTVEDVTMCGECLACKTGSSRLCRDGRTLEGQPGMSDELIVHQSMLNPFTGMDFVSACMTEPLAVAIRCVEKLDFEPMSDISIFGMGAIGLFCLAYAKLRGAGKVTMIAREAKSERNNAAAKAAMAYGADEILFTSHDGWLNAARERFDYSIIAAPPSLAGCALSTLKYGGTALACGVSLSDEDLPKVDVNDMVFNKKALITSLAEPAENFPLSMRLIKDGRIDVSRVITHELPLSEADELKRLYAEDAPAIKTVIIP